MKNTNFKSKHIARIMLLILLLSSAINLAGCDIKEKYKFRASYDFDTIIAARAYSDTNIFDIENVTFLLSYAIHELNLWGEADTNPKEQLPSIYHDDKLMLEICVCNGTHQSDYKDTRCCVKLNTIKEEKLFSKEYGYIDTPFFISNGIVFMHTEIITIPSYLFVDDYGDVDIHLLLMNEDERKVQIDTQRYLPYSVTIIPITYKKIDENKIELISPY